MDPVLTVLLLLKNNWNLTESGLTQSSIKFSSGWYNESIMFPQITVTSQPGGTLSLQETGATPVYLFQEVLTVNIWVRPEVASNKSIGGAKHKEYEMRKETMRILRTGSHISTGSNEEEFLTLGRWRRLDELTRQPVPILRSSIVVVDNYYRGAYEETP